MAGFGLTGKGYMTPSALIAGVVIRIKARIIVVQTIHRVCAVRRLFDISTLKLAASCNEPTT